MSAREGGFGAAFVAAFAAEVAALLGPRRADAQDFEALEQALRRRVLGLAAQALAQYFNADDADHSDSTVACACGGRAGYAGRRPKTFITLLGPLTLERGLLPLRRLPYGGVSARPGVGPARHVAVARRVADGGACGLRLQLRRGQRPVVGTGRGARRDQAGRARRRSPGT